MATGGKKKVLLKIIILGDSGVGKTALLHKYVNSQFIEEHKATIGADFLTKEISIDDKLVTLQIWDTAGQERFQSLGIAFYRGADACVLVYDITNQESFENINTWRSNFLDQCHPQDPLNFPFLLVGNKYDLSNDRQVQTSDGERYARNNNDMLFYETSALNGHQVETALRAISATASEMDTAPFFSHDVVERIKLEEKGVTAPAPNARCFCSLL